MCVIAVARKGTPFPSYADLHAMWQANSHGAGFMYQSTDRNGQPSLRVVKGLMTFTALKRALTAHRDNFMEPGDDGLTAVDTAVHFRIASAGGTTPILTHPFSAGQDVAIMHNGHISSLAYDDFDKLKDSIYASQTPSRSYAKAMGAFANEFDQVVASYAEKNGLTVAEAERILSINDPAQQKAQKERELVAPESDTSRLASMLGQLPKGWQRNRVVHHMIVETFLKSDRVVIFDSKGLCRILGEKLGGMKRGVWYSNMYWDRSANNGVTRVVSGKDLDKEGSKSTSATQSTLYPIPTFIDDDKPRTVGEWVDEARQRAEERRRRTPKLGCTVGSGASGESSTDVEGSEVIDPDVPVDPRIIDEDDDFHYALGH